MKTLIIPALAAVSLAMATSARAEQTSVEVQYSDIDLSTPEGIERLNGRIKAALDRVCGKPALRDVKVAASQRACREQTATTAFADVARVIEEKTGIALASMLLTDRRG